VNEQQYDKLASTAFRSLFVRLSSYSPVMVLVLALAVSSPALLSAAQPLTPEQIYPLEEATRPPGGITWTPDGTLLSYIDEKGELIGVEGGSGKRKVLISEEKMKSLAPPASSEHDRNNRSRYKIASYFWAPDSKHILFDSNGQLWFFDLATGTGLQMVSTGAGSGDDPKFSPDGQYLSYLHDHNLWLRRLRDTTTPTRLTDSQSETVLDGEVDWVYEEELDVRSNYFWSPDSRHIAFLQMNEASVPEYPITDWIPTHPTVDHQRYPQPGDSNPAVRVGIVPAAGGRTRWIDLPIESGQDYIPRFGWLNAKTVWIEALSRDHKKLILYFADIARDQVQPVLTETDKKFLDESYDIKFFANNFLLTSWRDGHKHLYLYAFHQENPLAAEATLVKQLTTGNFEVAAVSGIDQVAHRVYYLANEGDPRQQQIWAVGLDGQDKHLVTHAGEWHEPVFSPNTNFFADVFSSTAIPPTLDLCRHQTDCQTLWKPKPPTDQGWSAVVTPPKNVEFKAADGTTTLYGELILPEGKTKPGSVPLILNPYGGPHAQLVSGQWAAPGRLIDQLLLQKGFAVLHVDNRGMGGRGRDFAQAAYQDFGAVQLSDQLAALDQTLRSYPQLDPKRLGWWGWSWGGTFTLYAMTHSDRFLAGVAGAPVTDWENYDSVYTERYLGMPEHNAQVYSENSVVNYAALLKGRLLIIHGTGDDNVHLSNSIQFIQKLIDADLPYDLQLYPRKTHGVSGPAAITHLNTRLLDHFEHYVMDATQ
jgi:dipeptidyl-peptidase 4